MNQLLKTIDVTRDLDNSFEILEKVAANIHIVGVDSDLFFTPEENRETYKQLAQVKNNVTYGEINSVHGHDAFLIEFEQLEQLLAPIFKENNAIYHVPISKVNIDKINKIQYFAPYTKGVQMYFQVDKISIKPRNEISYKHYINKKTSTENYFVLEVSKKKLLPQTIKSSQGNFVIRHGKLSALRKAKTLKDLK